MDHGTPLIRYTDRAGDERRMVIRMESASAVPRFEQLRGQISVMVAVGRLEPGSRLPTVRELAAALDMAPGTVARLPRTRSRRHRHDPRPGRHLRRRRAAPTPDHAASAERVAATADRFVFTLAQLGLGPDEMCNALGDALDRAAEQPDT